MELYRSRRGETFHAPGCYIPGGRSEWLWARPRTYQQVLEDSQHLGIQPCKRCLPPTPTPTPEETNP